jgi:hypothetical protein
MTSWARLSSAKLVCSTAASSGFAARFGFFAEKNEYFLVMQFIDGEDLFET